MQKENRLRLGDKQWRVMKRALRHALETLPMTDKDQIIATMTYQRIDDHSKQAKINS